MNSNKVIVFVFLLSQIGLKCHAQHGIGRWKVKTISDADTVKINFDSIVPSSIHEQLQLPIERHLKNKRSPTETTVYSITCRLLAFRKTIDSDIHLIIQDTVTNETMVAEIANPKFVAAKTSQRISMLIKVRDDFYSAIGKPGKYFNYIHPPPIIKITGIGFFDICHGQKGMARNCREIHPVLSLIEIGN